MRHFLLLPIKDFAILRFIAGQFGLRIDESLMIYFPLPTAGSSFAQMSEILSFIAGHFVDICFDLPMEKVVLIWHPFCFLSNKKTLRL